ncbi:hypothetical protein GCM10009757_01680 [Streptomyces cheonanensis]|uniref:Uncharacterized protein n=1 Tax=Streptomyces cheonanensis TaxID=312720 RepID=A0ABN2UM98_9ACTN
MAGEVVPGPAAETFGLPSCAWVVAAGCCGAVPAGAAGVLDAAPGAGACDAVLPGATAAGDWCALLAAGCCPAPGAGAGCCGALPGFGAGECARGAADGLSLLPLVPPAAGGSSGPCPARCEAVPVGVAGPLAAVPGAWAGGAVTGALSLPVAAPGLVVRP